MSHAAQLFSGSLQRLDLLAQLSLLGLLFAEYFIYILHGYSLLKATVGGLPLAGQ